MKVKRSMEKYSLQCSPLPSAFNADCQELKGCATKIIFLPGFSFNLFLSIWIGSGQRGNISWKFNLILCYHFRVRSTHACVFTRTNPGVIQTALSILWASFFSRPSLLAPLNFFAVVCSTQFHPSDFSCFLCTSFQDTWKSAAERVHQRNHCCLDYFFSLFPCWLNFRDRVSGEGK